MRRRRLRPRPSITGAPTTTLLPTTGAPTTSSFPTTETPTTSSFPTTETPSETPTTSPAPSATPTTSPAPTAEPVTWYLRSVQFTDGTTATGSFDYNAGLDENRFSNVMITTEENEFGDPILTADPTLLRAVPSGILPADLKGQPYLSIDPDGPGLPDSGSVNIDRFRSSEGVCTNSDCTATAGSRSFFSGFLTTDAPTPKPSEVPTTTPSPSTEAPSTPLPTTEAPSTTPLPTTEAPTTPPTPLPTTEAPTTLLPTTSPAPTTEPVTWYLRSVEFDDGSTATGSFEYNAGLDENRFSNIMITIGEDEYGDPVVINDAMLLRAVPSDVGQDGTGKPYLSIDTEGMGLPESGTVDIRVSLRSSEGFCTNPDCTSTTVSRSIVSGGYVTTDPSTPSPSPTSVEEQCHVKKCSEEGCCGGGSKWSPKKGCHYDPSSSEWDAEASSPSPDSDDFTDCKLRSCCEYDCCGKGTYYSSSQASCIPY